MSTITKPMALDESFNTTESTPRNQADVLVGIESAIRQGFGQVASAVEYDNTDSGLTADNVQDAIDEVDDTVDGLVDDVTEISSDIESTQIASGNPIAITDAAPINAESLVVELEPIQDGSGDPSPTNIRPITGYTECEVDDVGKNLFDIDSLIAGNIDNNGYDYADGYATYRRTPYIRLKAGNYVIKRIGNTSEWWKGFLYNSQDDHDGIGFVFNTNTDSVATFTAQTDCWLRIAFDYTPTTAEQIQLESGSQPTTFVPYSSTSASIQFGQTVYGGRSNFTDGGTDVDKTKVKVSDLTPYGHYNGTNATCSSFSLSDNANSVQYNQTHGAIADRMTEAAAYYGWHHENEEMPAMPFFSISTDGTLLSLYDEDTTLSQSDFLAKYGDTEICYPKATPTTISTPPTDLKLLKGTNNLSTNGTTINLGYQPDNVVGEVKEKADKINFSEIVKYTISGNTADLIPLVIDGTGHNDIPIVTDITKYRFLCIELVLKPSTKITGVYFSAIAFTDGIYLPSGISIPVYRPSDKFYASVTINPDGNGGFKLSYVAVNQSQSTPPDYYSIRVRAFNQY